MRTWQLGSFGADYHLGKLRRSKVSVLLTEEELARLERYCLELGHKKSTLIARLIRDHLNAEQLRVQGELPPTKPQS